MGLHELPWRLRGPDLTFSEPRSPTAVVSRVRPLGSSHRFAFDTPEENVQVSLLDNEGGDRVVQIGKRMQGGPARRWRPINVNPAVQ